MLKNFDSGVAEPGWQLRRLCSGRRNWGGCSLVWVSSLRDLIVFFSPRRVVDRGA